MKLLKLILLTFALGLMMAIFLSGLEYFFNDKFILGSINGSLSMIIAFIVVSRINKEEK